jgi:hypothetical protein
MILNEIEYPYNENNICPFNRRAMIEMVYMIPQLVPAGVPYVSADDLTTDQLRIFIYDKIADYNHKKLIKNYNLFFEAIVSESN